MCGNRGAGGGTRPGVKPSRAKYGWVVNIIVWKACTNRDMGKGGSEAIYCL